MLSGTGNDRLTAYLAQSVVFDTGAGNDTLDGSAGMDVLDGGTGDDLFTGGTGDDTFLFSTRLFGHDRLQDFHAGRGSDDHISFIGLGLTAANLKLDSAEQGLSMTITIKGTGESIYLAGVDLAMFSIHDDLIF